MIFRHLLNMRSHPTWVRGLKHFRQNSLPWGWGVAPYVGAWIETEHVRKELGGVLGRTLRGCVD